MDSDAGQEQIDEFGAQVQDALRRHYRQSPASKVAAGHLLELERAQRRRRAFAGADAVGRAVAVAACVLAVALLVPRFIDGADTVSVSSATGGPDSGQDVARPAEAGDRNDRGSEADLDAGGGVARLDRLKRSPTTGAGTAEPSPAPPAGGGPEDGGSGETLGGSEAPGETADGDDDRSGHGSSTVPDRSSSIPTTDARSTTSSTTTSNLTSSTVTVPSSPTVPDPTVRSTTTTGLRLPTSTTSGSTTTETALDQTCFGLVATIVGTQRDDVLIGTEGDDVIVGLSGQDRIEGLGGNDTICGGTGKDVIYGGAGDDRIDGQNGKDELYGGTGDDEFVADRIDTIFDE